MFSCKRDEITAIMRRVEKAQIEVYVPTHCDESYSGTIIFWNASIKASPEAIFTTSKIHRGERNRYYPLVACTLQSAMPQDDFELTLDDHLPREIHDADDDHWPS